MDWNDFNVVLVLCREGSLSAAAKKLGCSHSTVFRQINSIEHKYATRFFNRLSHGYEMTEAGETVLKRAASIEADLLDLQRELKSKDRQLEGNIRVSAPEGLSNYLLASHLAQFYRQHPRIEIELLVSADNVLLSKHQADIAIRTTRKPPDNCIGRKVCDFSVGIYASAAYLERVLGQDFREYDYLQINNGVNWFPPPYWDSNRPPRIIFKGEGIQSVIHAANEGIGAVILPCFIGTMEPGLQLAALPFGVVSELWILSHADLRQTVRVRTLMDYLYQQLSEQKSLFEGDTEHSGASS